MSDIPEFSDWYQESAYGPIAAKLGVAAVSAVDVLAAVPEWRGEDQRRWLASDHVAFRATIRVAYQVREAQSRLHMPEEALDRYDDMPLDWHLDSLHEALPLSEGERHWLIQYFFFANGGGPQEDATERILGESKYEDEGIFDAGRWHRLDGPGLLDRWWAWRRSALEFEEAGTLDMTCKALGAIADITVPRMPLSQEAEWRAKTDYAELMRFRRKRREEGASIADRRAQPRTQPT